MLIQTDPSIIQGYLEDASGFTKGRAERLVIPDNAGEIAVFLQAAALRQEPVTISGGRTGVAAGCIAQGGALLSLERLDAMDPVLTAPGGGSVRLGPAVRLETLKQAAAEAGLIYGPDPTERTGSIGGNVSTNASGGQCFRYGTTRNHVLGLTAVLSTGEVLELERGQIRAQGDWLRLPLSSGRVLEFKRPDLPALAVTKNAAGYFSQPGMDAIDLLIGTEGTLAVITRVRVKLLPAPAGLFTLAVFFPDLAQTLECSHQIRAATAAGSLTPASLEFMDAHSLDLLRAAFPKIPESAQAVLLIEQEFAGDPDAEQQALDQWLAFLEGQKVPDDLVWFAQTRKDRQHLRDFRHALPETVNTLVRQRGLPKVGTDMAVPEARFPEMLDIYYQVLASSGMDFLVFGHIGECPLHVNVLPRNPDEYAVAKKIYMGFARDVVARGGTVSAEHGIGKLKHDFLRVMVGEQGFREMARVKKIFDPPLILNRGNVFPEEYLTI